MHMTRLVLVISLVVLLASCNRLQDHCKRVELGMTVSEVREIMGPPKDSHFVGHPPVGLMLIYGSRNLDKPGFVDDGPIAIELHDAPSRRPEDRTVAKTYCRDL